MSATSHSPSTSCDIPTIIFEDDTLLVVEKPADLLTVPGRGEDKQDCLINRLLVSRPDARIIHRLDMATSGIVLLAKSHQIQADMGRLFEKRQVQKVYIAVVTGEINHEGTINLPLICDWENRPKQIVDEARGKPACTHYTRVNYDSKSNTSRVELRPVTGRSHELRVHMQALGHPILGDYFYAPINIKEQSTRLLLHAHQISFNHPETKQPMQFTSAVPF